MIRIIIKEYRYCLLYTSKTNREIGLSIVDISPKALDLLIQYDWPGNVRELRHNVERACFIRGAGMLEYEHFRQIKERMSQNNVQEVETALNLSLIHICTDSAKDESQLVTGEQSDNQNHEHVD